MAARFWQLITAGEIVFAAAAAWLLMTRLPLSRPAMIAIALAILAALQWLPAAAAWAFAQSRMRTPRALEHSERKRSRFASVALRSIATEGIALARAQLLMSVAPLRRRLDSSCGDRRPRPVLLIHGVLCNGAIWRTVGRRLELAGWGPVRTLDLEPLSADIEAHAARVAEEVTLMQRECGGERVAIVAHSMGGLVARAALSRLPRPTAPGLRSTPPAQSEVVRCIVTLATPHHGTTMAGLLRSKPMRQMLPGSPWLRELEASLKGEPGATPITSIYSLDDELVVPASSARLEGARNIELRGVGHLGLLTSRQASEAILRALARD